MMSFLPGKATPKMTVLSTTLTNEDTKRKWAAQDSTGVMWDFFSTCLLKRSVWGLDDGFSIQIFLHDSCSVIIHACH